MSPADREVLARLLDALSSLAAHAPAELHAAHLAEPAKDWAQRVRSGR